MKIQILTYFPLKDLMSFKHFFFKFIILIHKVICYCIKDQHINYFK
jgi:hypothetical protein